MSISVSNISFGYTENIILNNVTFSAEDGQLTAVLGPNGVGKTTLFRCILGLEKKYSGTVLTDGLDTKTMDAVNLARKIAYIPQIRQQIFGFSVMDMVLMGTTNIVKGFALPGKKEMDIARDAMAQLNIEGLADKDYGRISGGEQQLVLIARAMAQQSRNLLMDEPTSALDYGNQARVMQEVRNLADKGYCVILSTHNPQHAIWYADKALALSEGSIAAWDNPDTIITKALIEKLYGIDVTVMNTDEGRVIAPKTRPKTDGR